MTTQGEDVAKAITQLAESVDRLNETMTAIAKMNGLQAIALSGLSGAVHRQPRRPGPGETVLFPTMTVPPDG